MKKIVVGISGASGTIYAIRLLEMLKQLEAEIHLVVSRYGEENLRLESDMTLEDLRNLATVYYDNNNLGEAIASGSRIYDAMFIVPCSMKTVSALANGYTDSLITRAGDVFLKEKRPLVLVPRETPLNEIHLKNMLQLSQLGARIVPPMPAFYNHPKSIDDLVNHQVMRLLDQIGIHIKGGRYLE